MFEQSTLPRAPRRLWATSVGMAAEAVLVGCMVLTPLIWPQVIPPAGYITALALPGPPLGRPPKGNTARVQHRTGTKVFHAAAALTEPTAAPRHAAMIVDPPPEVGDIGVPGGFENVVEGSLLGSVVGSVDSNVRPPVVPRPPEPVKPAPVPQASVQRLILRGGDVSQAVPLFRPEPIYPGIARSMRVSGVVELIGVIGTDGRIKELHVKSGHPLLARAALEAVARWIYQPTLLNGVPVEVEAPIIVTFKLN